MKDCLHTRTYTQDGYTLVRMQHQFFEYTRCCSCDQLLRMHLRETHTGPAIGCAASIEVFPKKSYNLKRFPCPTPKRNSSTGRRSKRPSQSP